VGLVKDSGLRVIGQFHDEVCIQVKAEDAEAARKQLKDCIGAANKILQLNIQLDVDTQVGDNYAEIH
jgi:DNA polymerase I-like protein with 3'-5' exonuclease and polymerase domains